MRPKSGKKSAGKKTRIAILDAYPIVRFGLSQLALSDSNLELVYSTDQPYDLIRVIPRVKPDIVLIDLSLKGLSGLDVIDMIRKKRYNVKMLVFSTHDEEI